MKKKILISAYSLDVGGIETALITLINKLSETDEITLVLEKRQGIFLDEISKNIKIIEYNPANSRARIISKIKNATNRLKFMFKYKNKFDCSISYATYSLPGSFVARTASKNSILWVHSEYMQMFKNNISEYKKFFRDLNAKKFRKIVFVSDSSKETFCQTMDNDLTKKTLTVNNLVDYKMIIDKSKEKVHDYEKAEETTFLYVGRLSEDDKKVSRLIRVCSRLRDNHLKFKLVIIGDGEDRALYEEMVSKNNLNSNILFLGKKKNPYPYFTLSDCLVLTSEHEGFPVVFIESMVLNVPIITTNVSDSERIINNTYGFVTDKDEDSIYKCLENFINNGYEIKEKFDAEKYNKDIIDKITKLIEGEE